MKILYLSCHSILEFEEISLFHELGHQVFSPGAYVDPGNPGDTTMRPGIPGLIYDPEVLAKYHAIPPGADGDRKDNLTKEFIDYFDAVIVMHIPRWIKGNWKVMKHKRVIWRTIGQSINSIERTLRHCRKDGLQVVRYSPMERNIPEYIGEDAMIRFYKNQDEYCGWTGEKVRVISFAQHMKTRDQACNFTFFENVTRPFERCLFGPGNGNIGPWCADRVPYDQLKKEMRENRVYFYTGTHPASYTLNFIESWMTGIPIVAIGSKYGNAYYFPGHDLYEIPHLIENGVTGFVSDSAVELQNHIRFLFESPEEAKKISERARLNAIAHFGKDKIKAQWQEFLGR